MEAQTETQAHPLIAHLLDRDAFVRHLQARLDLARTVEDETCKAAVHAAGTSELRRNEAIAAVQGATTLNDWAEARICMDATANAVAAYDRAAAEHAVAYKSVDQLQRELATATALRNEAVKTLEAAMFASRQPPAEPEAAPVPAAPQPPTPAPAAASVELPPVDTAPLNREDRIVAEVLQHQVAPCPDKVPQLPEWQRGGLITVRVRKFMANGCTGPVAVAAVAAGLKATATWQLNAVSDSLKYLAKLGEIQRIERGIYAPLGWRPTPVADEVDPECTKGLTGELLTIFDRNDQPLYFADIYARLSRPYDRGSVSSQLLRLVKKGDLAEVHTHADGADDRRWARAA